MGGEKKGGNGITGRERNTESRREEGKHEGKRKRRKRTKAAVFLSPAVSD